MPPKQRAANEKRKGGKAKKKSNRVPDEPEEQPFIEEEEEAETQPDAEDEDEESPALQRIVEFSAASPGSPASAIEEQPAPSVYNSVYNLYDR